MKSFVRVSSCLVSLIAAATLLAACGDPEPATEVKAKVANVAKSKKPVPAKASEPADPTAKMARAVGNGKPGAAVDIKYDILSRPEAGKPVEVEVALIPGPGVDGMNVKFDGMDGITLAGTLEASFAEVTAGEPYRHKLSLLAQHDGVFYITVVVDTQMGNSTLGRTFSIPFVVGTTVAAEQKAKPEPVKDASGQPIKPMQAEETGG